MKNRRPFTLLGAVCIVLPFSLVWAAPPKFSGSIRYLESLIQENNLREAVPYNTTVLKRIKKRIGENTPQYVQVYVNEAFLKTQMGQHKNVPFLLESIPQRITNVFSDSGHVALAVVTRTIDSYHELGQYWAAYQVVVLGEQIIKNTKDWSNSDALIAFQLRKAINYNERGFSDFSRKLTDSLLKVQEIRLNRSENRIVQGKNVFKRLTGKELRQRKEMYAGLYINLVNTYLKKGEYRPCYAKVREANTWIIENLGRKNAFYAQNNNIQGYLNDAYEEYTESTKYFKKSLQKHQDWDKTHILTSLAYANAYALGQKPLAAWSELNRTNVKIKSRYGSDNVIQLEKELVAYTKNKDIFPNKLNEIRLHQLQKRGFSIADVDKIELTFLENYVDVYKRFNRISDAEDSLKKSVELKKLLYGEDSPEYHAQRFKLAQFYFIYTNQFVRIDSIYQTSFFQNISKHKATSHKDYVGQLTEIAKFYELTDKFDLAITYAQRAADIEKENSGEVSAKYAIALGYLAKVMTKYGNAKAAQDILGKSFNTLNQNKPKNDIEKVKFSETYESLAKVYNILGMYTEAQNSLKESSKYAKRIRNSSLSINNTEELANFYIQTGLYENAEDLLLGTIKQKEKFSKNFQREIIGPLNLLSEVYLIQGEYAQAEKNIRKAMATSAEVFGDSSVKYIESLKNLIELYSALGDYKKAILQAKLAMDLSKTRFGANHTEYAKELSGYGLLKFKSSGMLTPEIESLLLESATIVKNSLGDKNPLYAQEIKTLAFVYLKSNKTEEAEKLLLEANQIWIAKLGNQNINTAKVNLLLGDIQKSKRNFTKAEEYYLASQKTFGRIFNAKHPLYLESESKLGQLYLSMGNPEKAITYFDKTTAVYLDFIKKFFPSLSFREKTKFWDSFKDEFELFDYTAFLLKDKNPKYLGKVFDNTMATKALLLSTSIKVREQIMRSGNAALIDEYSEWIAKKELLTRAVSMTNEQLAAAKIDIPKVEKEIEQKEKYLSEQSELFAENSDKRVFHWTDFKKKLKPSEYVVEIIRFRKYGISFSDTVIYAALVLPPNLDKGPEIVVFKEGNNLENRYLKYYRNSVRFKQDDEYSSAMFWHPLQSKIPANASVFVSCEGVFNQINLETMKNTDGSFAIDKYKIQLVSNSKDILVKKSKPKQDTVRFNNHKIALIGNPKYYTEGQNNGGSTGDRSFNYIAGNQSDTLSTDTDLPAQNSIIAKEKIRQLPGAEVEVKDIDGILSQKKWQSEVYVFAEADEDRIKEIVNPQVFHIATHGFFMEDTKDESNGSEWDENKITNNPLVRSGLLLKSGGDILDKNDLLSINNQNGVLTAYEAMNLNFDNTELVVLSACETGLGKVQIGEGVFGLQRAFLVAGADAVIMSLFKVNDKVTQELMEEFYKNWLAGKSKRASFAMAKQTIKAKYPEPLFWGSFIMVGGD